MARRGKQLIAIGEELLAEAKRMSALGETCQPISEPTARNYPILKGQPLEAKAQALYAGRRIRDKLFSADLFGEPSWDILLDLFVAERRGRKLQVSTVCIGAQVPNTTALRYIGLLEVRGYIDRECDPQDSRRIFLRLTSLGMARMTNFFEMTDALQISGNPAVSKLRLASGGGAPSSG